MKIDIALFFLLFLFSSAVYSQPSDTINAIQSDSIARANAVVDSLKTERSLQFADHVSFYKTDSNTLVKYDVQQINLKHRNQAAILILFFLLLIITYVKVAFGNDLEELLQSVISRNMAMQIFRTRTDEISFSSILLHLNSIMAISLFFRTSLIHFYPAKSFSAFNSIAFLIILFTFFYLIKIIVVRLLGYVFEIKEASDEYIYNFSIAFKTVGMTLIPILFVFYVAPEKYFNFIFILSCLLILLFTIQFLWRGLSTGRKLLYQSMYHFFIYVCVVEISPIFLLFKLLTKTVV